MPQTHYGSISDDSYGDSEISVTRLNFIRPNIIPLQLFVGIVNKYETEKNNINKMNNKKKKNDGFIYFNIKSKIRVYNIVSTMSNPAVVIPVVLERNAATKPYRGVSLRTCSRNTINSIP